MCLPTELDLALAYRIVAKVGRHQGRTEVEKTRRAALKQLPFCVSGSMLGILFALWNVVAE